MPESRSANGERHVPLAGMRIDEQQYCRWSEHRTLFRPRARIGRHAQLRGKAGERFRKTATEIVRQPSHVRIVHASSEPTRGNRRDVLMFGDQQDAEAGEHGTKRAACNKQEPEADRIGIRIRPQPER